MVGTRAVRTVAQPSTTRKSQERVAPSSHRHPQSIIKRRAAKALGRESTLVQSTLGSCRTVREDGQLRLLRQMPGRRPPDPLPRSRCLLPCPPAFSDRPVQRPRPVARFRREPESVDRFAKGKSAELDSLGQAGRPSSRTPEEAAYPALQTPSSSRAEHPAPGGQTACRGRSAMPGLGIVP